MLRRALPVVLAALVIAPLHAQTRAAAPAKPGVQAAAQVYFPERLDWQKKKPEEVGMDSALIAEAVEIASMVTRWQRAARPDASSSAIVSSPAVTCPRVERTKPMFI
jgi:hypothetical protein